MSFWKIYYNFFCVITVFFFSVNLLGSGSSGSGSKRRFLGSWIRIRMKTFADPKHCFLVGAQGITPVTATLYTSLARPHKLHTLVLRIYRYQREIQYSAPATTGTWCQDWLGARRASHWDWCTRWRAGGPQRDGSPRQILRPKNWHNYMIVRISRAGRASPK